MMLYSEVDYDLERISDSHYCRVKVFDQEGVRYARVEIPAGSRARVLEGLQARTVHPDGRPLNFTGQVHTGWKFTMRGRRPTATFDLPEVTPGSIIEYRYRNQFYPEKVPQSRVFVSSNTGGFQQLISESQYFYWPVPGELFVRQARIVIHPRLTNSFQRFYPDYHTEGLASSAEVTVKSGSITGEARNIPAASTEGFPGPSLDLAGRVELYFREHQAEPEKDFWGRFAQFTLEGEARFLASDKLVRQLISEMSLGADSPEAKLRKLYARAQQIRNLDFQTILSEDGHGSAADATRTLAEVVRQGSGNSREINLTFLAMARAAGFEAESIYLASRDLRTFDPNLLDRSQFDSSAVWVQTGGAGQMLDPGTPACPYGTLPWQKYSTEAMRLSSKHWQMFTTPEAQARDSRLVRTGALELSSQGSLHGTVRVSYFGQKALELRLQSLGTTEDERMGTLSALIHSSLPRDAVVENLAARGWEASEGPLMAEFQLSLPAAVTADGRVSMPREPLVSGGAGYFEDPAPSRPVHYSYPYEENDDLEIRLPANLTLDQVPARKDFAYEQPGVWISPPVDGDTSGLRRRTPGQVPAATLHLASALTGNTLVMKRALVVACETVKSDDIPRFREFLMQLKAADGETIVLRPVEAPHP